MHASALALYRAYRPRTFAELVGQEHVARTLRNAIARGRVGHAYLFGGPRGTGKTSAARILARAVNCEGERPEPGEPCGRCPACQSIADGSAMDVLEIDAASNRGIEEIRELRERAHYAPTRLRTKVYIVDEAHMLTNEAFNALLKTLEEPPPRTLFVLATTEPQRIPATIVSRCQFFEFRRLTVTQVVERLRAVCAAEDIPAEEEALYAIARHARGGLRDALALLDQVRACDAEGRVRARDVLDLLGLPEEEVLIGLTEAAADGDAARGLQLLHRLYEQGREPRQVLLTWLEHLRHLVALQVAPDHPGLVPAAAEQREAWRVLAERLPPAPLRALVTYLAERDALMRWVPNPRLLLETAFLAACDRLAGGARPSAGTARVPDSEAPARDPGTAARAEAVAAAEPAEGRHREEPVAARAAAPAVPHPEAPAAAGGAITLDEVLAAWPEALARVRRQSKPAHAVWQEGRPVAVEGGRVDVAFAHAFHCSACEQPSARGLMERALGSVLGRPVRVRPFLQQAAAPDPDAPREGPGGDPPVAPRGAAPGRAPAAERPDAGSEPRSILEQAAALFGGEFVDPGEGWR